MKCNVIVVLDMWFLTQIYQYTIIIYSIPLLTFLQGLEETSKEALKALCCGVVRMVRGRLGLRGSLLSLLHFLTDRVFSDFTSSFSSSFLSVTRHK